MRSRGASHGNTEKAVAKLFEQTIPEYAAHGAAIILLDEVETLAAGSSAAQHGSKTPSTFTARSEKRHSNRLRQPVKRASTKTYY